ncbi:Fur-regulated basic protein B [[Bacillus thuringiensis] serovar konkukian]|nr:FbpB family small basic protein [Bacillus thuringiensis]MED1305250.1 FbpB family small basic protein [Bacillus pacificus]OUB14302.1 Fur-regulated basic protein B [[Bacillus thuringiensis] serovar konkukian]
MQKKKSFKKLLLENKQLLLSDKDYLRKIEEKIDKRHESRNELSSLIKRKFRSF